MPYLEGHKRMVQTGPLVQPLPVYDARTNSFDMEWTKELQDQANIMINKAMDELEDNRKKIKKDPEARHRVRAQHHIWEGLCRGGASCTVKIAVPGLRVDVKDTIDRIWHDN